ncbi:nudix hydrolase 14 [Teratosphaeria nubilosa]|uniref:Nudix hydrolase 14 n=1 Tax=Teratosphaeria nubilosa TaxID=161662 RepID=A0A6G1L1G8_9PEZI|nr:nudix hydrolase 14 [Teratosphaeria nubilosa]
MDDAGNNFCLKDGDSSVPVALPDGLTEAQLLGFKAFSDWHRCLKNSLEKQKLGDHPFRQAPYRLRHIRVDSFDKPRDRILFVKMVATITNDHGDALPGVVFLRGGSVAVLLILRPLDALDERYVVMTEQPRPAAGSLRFMEIPAGMLDDEENFAGAAAREIREEVGLQLNKADLIDMTALALKGQQTEENMRDAMYPSPGACDEFISIFLWEREKERMEIEDLKDKLAGERAEQENITVRLMNYERLLAVGARDAKTLAAWSLYEYLKRTRLLD